MPLPFTDVQLDWIKRRISDIKQQIRFLPEGPAGTIRLRSMIDQIVSEAKGVPVVSSITIIHEIPESLFGEVSLQTIIQAMDDDTTRICVRATCSPAKWYSQGSSIRDALGFDPFSRDARRRNDPLYNDGIDGPAAREREKAETERKVQERLAREKQRQDQARAAEAERLREEEAERKKPLLDFDNEPKKPKKEKLPISEAASRAAALDFGDD